VDCGDIVKACQDTLEAVQSDYPLLNSVRLHVLSLLVSYTHCVRLAHPVVFHHSCQQAFMSIVNLSSAHTRLACISLNLMKKSHRFSEDANSLASCATCACKCIVLQGLALASLCLLWWGKSSSLCGATPVRTKLSTPS
jgi:hypothetical protein